MFMSTKEFAEFLARKPNASIHGDFHQIMDNGRETKYRNKKVYVYADGFACEGETSAGHGKLLRVYDSVKEYRRHSELILLERAGRIRDLEWQKKLVIQEAFSRNGKRVREISYVADFAYVQDSKQVIEDVKGLDQKTGQYRMTEAFKLKWKLLKARYPKYEFKIY